MKHPIFFRFASSFLLLLATAFPAFSQDADDLGPERITRFHSILHVQRDCSVKVTERISVVSRGEQIVHGIYRDLPLEYDYQGGRTDVGFELVGVTLDGNPEDSHTESLDNGIRIYMGSKDMNLDEGRYTFELTYVVNHVLGFFKTYDEFYWNVNGTGWIFDMDSVSAEVYYPEGAQLQQFSAYTGSQGDSGKDFAAHPIAGGMYFSTTRPLHSGENMTIAVAWNKNHLVYPSGMDNFLYWIKSHFLWIIGALGLLITLIYNCITWFRYGRDPKPGTIMPLYAAPEGFTPADTAFLYNYGRKTSNMFTGQLVSLATKGRLAIDVQEPGGMFTKKTYTITKTEPKGLKIKTLLPLEEQFYNSLFSESDTVIFKQGTYNPHLRDVQEELVEQVSNDQGERYMLQRNQYKIKQYIAPILMLGVGVLGYFQFGGNIAILITAFALCFISNIIFGRLFEQPTALGRKSLDELAGFKLYMQYSDRERIRLMNPPDMNFEHFEQNLPYAIALDVSKEWSGQFDPKELQQGTSMGGYWYTGAMLMGMHSFDFSDLSSTISSAATPPSSSSSGSGGGGFSGGGGGGGGGGGW